MIPAIIAVMIGRPLENSFPQRPKDAATGPVLLQVRDVCAKPQLGPISFTARAGEIGGCAGLEGAGVEQLFRVLFGLEPMISGQVLVRDEPQRLTTPRAAMDRGWALIPASRREHGLMMDWSIARNTTLLVLDSLRRRLGLIDKPRIRSATDRYVGQFGIVCGSRDDKIVTLSGGNQQKVLLAKWLARDPAIVILNDPTRGVDVGAKREIYGLC